MKIDLKSIFIGLTAGIIIGSIGLTTVYGSANNKSIDVSYSLSKVSVQDNPIAFSAEYPPFIYKDTAYAPIRTLAENLGFITAYQANDSSVSLYSKDASKVKLLKTAVDALGVSTPEKAIDIWSTGLKERNAALQYCVMTDTLKKDYEKSLEENDYDFWITGVSSPWVETYEILDKHAFSDNRIEYKLKYHTKTSEGNYYFLVTLVLAKEGDNWKIENLTGDEDSQAYTGYFS